MQKIKLFLIGFGFFWLFLWSVVGSILGAKINLIIATKIGMPWLQSLEKNILTAAHAHANSMAIILILFAFSINYLRTNISVKILKKLCYLHLIAIILFGIGMLGEAFYLPQSTHISIFSIFTAIGAAIYLLTIGLWSALFFMVLLKS